MMSQGYLFWLGVLALLYEPNGEVSPRKASFVPEALSVIAFLLAFLTTRYAETHALPHPLVVQHCGQMVDPHNMLLSLARVNVISL